MINSEKFQDIFPEPSLEELKKSGYTNESLGTEEKQKQLQETENLHQHLQELNRMDQLGNLSSDDLKNLKEIPSIPEQKENRERLKIVAKNIIDCYDWDPTKESFLVITDAKVVKLQPDMIKAINDELSSRCREGRTKGSYKIIIVPESQKSAEPLGKHVGEFMKNSPVLLLVARSRTHSKETGSALRTERILTRERADEILKNEKITGKASEKYPSLTKQGTADLEERISDQQWNKFKDLAKKTRSRLISVTKGHNPFEILTKGAVLEPVEKIKERGEKVNELLKDVTKVHLTSSLGTDLWVEIDPQKNELESGKINQPGQVSNYPIGEWACAIKWEGSNGILVIDGPFGGSHNLDQIDQPITLTIKDGEVVNIDGGEAAKKLKIYLDSGNDQKNHAYKLAEFAVGTNSQACKDKPLKYWGSSETEKLYRSAHIAVGSNGSFGVNPEDPYYNPAAIHCDMILLQQDLNIKCFRKDNSKFMLMEKQKAIGY